MCSNYPEYEVWGGWCDEDDMDAVHLQDCFSLDEARESCYEYQRNPNRYAFVKNKDTGEVL